MRRYLFTLAAGASAVLCAGVCVLWVRSYHVEDRWLRTRADGDGRYLGKQSLHVSAGEARVDHWRLDRPEPTRDPVDTSARHLTSPPGGVWQWDFSLTGRRASPSGRFLGCEWGTSRDAEWVPPDGWYEYTYDDLMRNDGALVAAARAMTAAPAAGTAYVGVVPLRWLAALTSLPPVARAVARLRRRFSRRRGLCPSCGYDLRATPGRCPECGAAPAR